MRLNNKDLPRNTLRLFWDHGTKGFLYYIRSRKHSIHMKKHLIPKKPFKHHIATKTGKIVSRPTSRNQRSSVTRVLLHFVWKHLWYCLRNINPKYYKTNYKQMYLLKMSPFHTGLCYIYLNSSYFVCTNTATHPW